MKRQLLDVGRRIKKSWDDMIPEVNAVVYTQDFGRPMPPVPPYPKEYLFMSPPQCDMAFVLKVGQFMRPMRDQPYWEPRDPKAKPPRWRYRTHDGIELVQKIVGEGLVESAYVADNYLTVLSGDRRAEGWEERMEALFEAIGETAMKLRERAGAADVVGYEFIEGNITDPRVFLD